MKIVPLILFLIVLSCALRGQTFVANYDETKMPAYTLPDPLVFNNGKPVKNRQEWKTRRAELVKIFEDEVYGKTPKEKVKLSATLLSENTGALEGKAIRREIQLSLQKNGKEVLVNVLLFLPKSGKSVPIFLGYNFSGNHTVSNDKDILITGSWVRNNTAAGITDNTTNETRRGSDLSSWPVSEIIARGYGLATLYYGDVDPDFDDGFQNGINSLFPEKRDGSSWGSIAGWTWGLSRVLDYLEKVKEVDSKRVIVLGHSRLGKTALWAGATDQRFAMVVSIQSGCGGAALSKRIYGETVARINTSFPHWFCENFRQYNNKEEELPVDQHELLALIAPRPLYVCSAEEDLWSDPRGEFLSCVAASPVYRLLGTEGFPGKDFPDLQQPVKGTIGYHIRSGKHQVKLYDWNCFMDFADSHLKK